jgi:alcohol dehydrogenase
LLLNDVSENEQQQADAFLAFMSNLTKSVGLDKRLREYGIKQEQLEILASEAMKQTRLLQNNPRPILFDDALALYQAAW